MLESDKRKVNTSSVKNEVKAICRKVIYIGELRYSLQQLNQSLSLNLAKEHCPSFYDFIQELIVDKYILELSKLFDPPNFRNFENLSLKNLQNTVNWSQQTQKNLDRNVKILCEIEYSIKQARNKILAHNDIEIILQDKTLGEYPDEDDKKLMPTLMKICNDLHKECFGKILGNATYSHKGDVNAFINSLIKASVFDDLEKHDNYQISTKFLELKNRLS